MPVELGHSPKDADMSWCAGGGGNWWRYGAGRSQRADARLSGVSYWGGTAGGGSLANNLDNFEKQVALCDAWNGGQPDAADLTMNLVTGGPNATDNDTITLGSALDWSSNSHWGGGWNLLPRGTIAIWACNLTSHDRATRREENNQIVIDNSIWEDIIAGNFDRAYTNMGRRI